MAVGKIVVTPERLETVSTKVNTLAEEYKKSYEGIYNTIEELTSFKEWEGKDNVTFVEQVNQFKDDLEYMYNLVRQYATYLRKSAAAYRGVQATVKGETKQVLKEDATY
ncbi:MAG: WXG100 family type VII secretion target [Eubacteriales bacterium]|nr:WXG100 family type VII secretion target [Eubacteriales bacterium]